MWETLEGMVREKAQEFIQQIMEEEVTELLGREKSVTCPQEWYHILC